MEQLLHIDTVPIAFEYVRKEQPVRRDAGSAHVNSDAASAPPAAAPAAKATARPVTAPAPAETASDAFARSGAAAMPEKVYPEGAEALAVQPKKQHDAKAQALHLRLASADISRVAAEIRKQANTDKIAANAHSIISEVEYEKKMVQRPAVVIEYTGHPRYFPNSLERKMDAYEH